MLAIAGKTAGPNWLTFFWKTVGTLGVTRLKRFFSKSIFFIKIRVFNQPIIAPIWWNVMVKEQSNRTQLFKGLHFNVFNILS